MEIRTVQENTYKLISYPTPGGTVTTDAGESIRKVPDLTQLQDGNKI